MRGKLLKAIRIIERKELEMKIDKHSALEIKNLIIDEKNNEVSCDIKFSYNENDRGDVKKTCTYYLDQLLK